MRVIRPIPTVLLAVSLATLGACSSGGGSSSGGSATPGSLQGVSINQLVPPSQPAGQDFQLDALGAGFEAGDTLVVGGVDVATTFVSSNSLRATVPAQAKGDVEVAVRRGGRLSDVTRYPITNGRPWVTPPAPVTVPEETQLQVTFTAGDPDGDPLRMFVEGMPPGARFDEAARTLTFRPDFIQGGETWPVSVTATDGTDSHTEVFSLMVQDSISPPWPTVTLTDPQSNHTRLRLSQTTDSWLDSPGHAGRSFTARVVIPHSASVTNKLPVRVYLHGFGGAPYTGGADGQYRIYPHDPDNTYWWGYCDQLPNGNPTSGTVPNYTQRRVLHLVEWLLKNYPGADREQVYVVGGSMGGAGSATLGLLYARHFAYVHSTIGQMVAGNHRPSRQSQLATFWGDQSLNLPDDRGMGVWHRQDLTRVVLEEPEARHQFVYTKHGKDDRTIHFGAVAQSSGLTGLSWYDVIQQEGLGHLAIWDEGGHGSSDPVLGSGWWDSGWNLMFNGTTYLRRNLAFPAFSGSSLDIWDPGDGGSNGNQTWNTTAGYAGSRDTPGDTGWNGDIAGALNRFLRWDANAIVDTWERVEMPLYVIDGSGEAAPQAGYPTKGDRVDSTLPASVTVTVRRLQRFALLPGEAVQWAFGSQSGTALANPDGSVTVAGLSLTTTPTPLILTR